MTLPTYNRRFLSLFSLCIQPYLNSFYLSQLLMCLRICCLQCSCLLLCHSATLLLLNSSSSFLSLFPLLPSSLPSLFLSLLILLLLYPRILRVPQSTSPLDHRKISLEAPSLQKIKLPASLPSLFLNIEGFVKPSSYILKNSSKFVP